MKKTLLVAGGAGFLGSHLCKRLIKDGNHVVCIDDFSTGNMENIADLLDTGSFLYYVKNITSDISFFDRIDGIFNLACPASPKKYQTDPIATMKTNVIGSLNLLELAKKYDVPILQASTSEVYGDPELDVLSEDYNGNVNTLGPRACYDEGKRAAETLFMDYNRMYGVDTKIIRIFNTYGPNMAKDDGRVISNFVNQALKNQPITIYGSGSQTRSFCYVSDQIEGIIKAFNSKDFHEPINIGNPDERTIKEVAEIIIQKTGSSSQLVYKDLPQDDPKKRFPDITRAKSILEWEPKVSLDLGLDLTIEHFRSLITQ
jgi:UDP-glucuronate decarboxylase